MADRPSFRVPSATPQISWFEFLLDPTGDVLRNYVKEKKPDPLPWNLCSLFIEKSNYQPNLGPQVSKDVAPLGDTKRGKQLRYLATVLCSYLRWNLDGMTNSLPLMVQKTVMGELKRGFNVPENYKSMDVDLNQIPSQSVMAWVIYHRWVIKCICRNSLGERMKKPEQNNANGKEAAEDQILAELEEILPASIELLEHMLTLDRDLEIPFLDPVIIDRGNKEGHDGIGDEASDQQDTDMDSLSQSSVQEETKSKYEKPLMSFPEYKETFAVPKSHVIAQICADLGMHYFCINSLDICYKLFHRLFKALEEDASIQDIVAVKQLKGFYSACASVLERSVNVPPQYVQNDLTNQLEESLRNDFQNTTEILMEDNVMKQIPLRLRTEIEARLHAMNRQDLLLPVSLINCLRCFDENGIVPREFLSHVERLGFDELNRIKIHLKKVITFLSGPLPTGASKINPKLIENFFSVFLRFVQPVLRDIFQTDAALKPFLPEKPLMESKRRRIAPQALVHDGSSMGAAISTRLFEGDGISNEEKYAMLKRQLTITFDPEVLRTLIEEMRGLYPDDICIGGFESTEYHEHLLEIEDPVLHDLLHILFTKSKHFSNQKEYRKTLSLLSNGLDALNQYVQQISPGIHHAKVKNVIHHELLWSEISWEQTKESINADTVRRCKACYHHRNQDPWPKKHVFEQMVSFLLNIKEWQFLIDEGGSFERQIDHREIGYHLALLSNGITRAGDFVRRDIAPGLWNAFVRTITEHVIPPLLQQPPTSNIQQQKVWRSPTSLSRCDLISFAKQIKEEILLSILVSCLATMLNIVVKDQERELSTVYQHIWPTAFDSSIPEPKEEQILSVLVPIVDHMIQFNPQNIAWIRNKADLDFFEGKYTDAMKRYLEIGAITTAFFSTPVHCDVWDDQVYKRLIVCCQNENAYTQVAILCQFLSSVDYTTAFKAIKEGQSNDASDALYECFWDVNILEFIIYMHNKRGEHDKKQLAIKIIGQPDINSCNSPEILKQSSDLRKCRFLRILERSCWK